MKIYICENCGKEHDGSYGSGRFCSKNCRCSFNAKKRKKFPTKEQLVLRNGFGRKRAPYGTWKCKVCGLIFNTKHQLWDHLHIEHPNDIKEFHGKGSIPWNKGLTKEIDQRIAKSADKLIEGFKSGRLIHPFKGKHHSEKYKKMMSIKRSKYLANNPDKHPWKKSTKFKSVPCEFFKHLLRENGCIFEEEYKPLKDRNFSIDVMFPSLKIGFEINGNQHYENHEKCILSQYYQERHNLIEAAGIKLIEIHYANVYHDGFIKRIIQKYHLK